MIILNFDNIFSNKLLFFYLLIFIYMLYSIFLFVDIEKTKQQIEFNISINEFTFAGPNLLKRSETNKLANESPK